MCYATKLGVLCLNLGGAPGSGLEPPCAPFTRNKTTVLRRFHETQRAPRTQRMIEKYGTNAADVTAITQRQKRSFRQFASCVLSVTSIGRKACIWLTDVKTFQKNTKKRKNVNNVAGIKERSKTLDKKTSAVICLISCLTSHVQYS